MSRQATALQREHNRTSERRWMSTPRAGGATRISLQTRPRNPGLPQGLTTAIEISHSPHRNHGGAQRIRMLQACAKSRPCGRYRVFADSACRNMPSAADHDTLPQASIHLEPPLMAVDQLPGSYIRRPRDSRWPAKARILRITRFRSSNGTVRCASRQDGRRVATLPGRFPCRTCL